MITLLFKQKDDWLSIQWVLFEKPQTSNECQNVLTKQRKCLKYEFVPNIIVFADSLATIDANDLSNFSYNTVASLIGPDLYGCVLNIVLEWRMHWEVLKCVLILFNGSFCRLNCFWLVSDLLVAFVWFSSFIDGKLLMFSGFYYTDRINHVVF